MFSLVIPLFNKAPYLQRALDSVFAQTFPPAEIIVVNDGSTDQGGAIARAQASTWIRVIDQSNRGVSAARNTGIGAATQPFVAFLDADDRWRPEFLSRMKAAIEAHPQAILYAAGFETIANGVVQKRHGIPRGSNGSAARESNFFRVCKGGHPLHMSTTVVSKKAAVAVGGFSEGVAFREDELFWAKLALYGKVVLSPEVLAEYDIAIPGQAVEQWRENYKKQVLEYDRFLANELRRQVQTGHVPEAFLGYCRHEFQAAMLQRLYRSDFAGILEFNASLDLDKLPLGLSATLLCWIAEHGYVQPPITAAMWCLRSVRDRALGRFP